MNSSNVVLSAHSFGGKVLLEYIAQLRQRASSKPIQFTTFILDSIPDLYDPDFDTQLLKHQSVFAIINTLKTAPETYPSKEAALKFLEHAGQTAFVSQWLLMNLVPVLNTEGKIQAWKFSFDIQGIFDLFTSFQHHSYWDLLEGFNQNLPSTTNQAVKGKIVFVRAGKNPFWKHRGTVDRLAEVCQRNPYVHLVTMPHVGHWLHSEDLLGLLEIMKSYLP